ncbi:MAG: response regulator [Agriterribacter sp.]
MKRVIVVEDDPAICDILLLAFKPLHIDLTCFDNGEIIIEGHYSSPDLFILDKQLPGIDGINVCKHLKSQERTRLIPVIMMSANFRIAELAGDAGADDMIMKPFNLNELKKMVLHYLGMEG